MDPDLMRIHQAAWFMYGCMHADDINLENATLDDLGEFVVSLGEAGLSELHRLAEELEYRDGAVWLGGIRLTPAYS